MKKFKRVFLSALIGVSCFTISTPSNVQAQESEATLLASYNFDGNVLDQSGNNNDGKVVGDVKYVNDLQVGNQVLYIKNPDGNAEGGSAPLQYVDLGNQIQFKSDDYALSFWWKDDRSATIQGDSGGTIIGNKNYNSGSNKGFAIGSFTSNIRVNFNADSERKEHRVTSFEDSKWHHIVVNYDRDGNMTTYIDGSKNQETSISSQKGKSIDVSGSHLVIGADGFFKNGVSGGYYDDLNVYSGTLNQQEITTLYSKYASSQAEAEKLEAIALLKQLITQCDEKLASIAYTQEDVTLFNVTYLPIKNSDFTSMSIAQLNEAISKVKNAQVMLDGKQELRSSIVEAKSLLQSNPTHHLVVALSKAIENAQSLALESASLEQIQEVNYKLQKEILRFQQAGDRLLSFSVLSDTHVGSGNDTNTNYLIDAMNDLKSSEPLSDTILIAGDYTQDGSKAQYANFQKVMEENWLNLGNQLVLTQGNHDVRWLCGTNPAASSDPNVSSSYCGLEDNFMTRYLPFKNKWLDTAKDSTTQDKTYYDTWIQDYHFISLNTEKDLKDRAYISDEQLAWFEETLAEKAEANKPIFIALHQPLNDTHARSTYWTVGDQDAKLKEILAKYPQAILISGHIHNGIGVASAVNNGYGTMLDAPSLAQNENGLNQQQIGYIVNVYEGYTQVRVYDFKNNKYRDEFEMIIDDTIENAKSESDDLASDLLQYESNVAAVNQTSIENAFDDNNTTYYRSNSINSTSVTITLKEQSIVDGIRYLPYQDYKVNGSTVGGRSYQMQGFIENYKVEISNDEGKTYQEVASGTWLSNNNWKRISFAAQQATNVRISALGSPSYNNNSFITIARLELTGDEFDFTSYTNLMNKASNLDAQKYTTTSFGEVTIALNNAKQALQEAALDVTQLTQTFTALTQAYENLQLRVSDAQYDAIQTIIKHFESLSSKDYTNESYESVKTFFANMKTQFENKDNVSEEVAMQLYLQGVLQLQSLKEVVIEEPNQKPVEKPTEKPSQNESNKPTVKPTPSQPGASGSIEKPSQTTKKDETIFIPNTNVITSYINKKQEEVKQVQQNKEETKTASSSKENVIDEETPLAQTTKVNDEMSSEAILWTAAIVAVALVVVGGLVFVRRKQ